MILLSVIFENILKKTKFIFKSLVIIYSIVLLCFSFFNYFNPLKININYSQAVYSENGTLMHVYLNNTDKWRIQSDFNKVSPLLKKTLLEKEDQYFYWHFGVNPIALFKATFFNLIKRKRVSGASTISMQVVRMLEPKKRTVFNKFYEILRATQLEIQYSKKEIFEMYLNLLPYGGNIEGIQSAALIYFNKKPEALSLSECVVLSIIPNRPTSLNIQTKNIAIEQAKRKWLIHFKSKKTFDKKLIDNALQESLNISRNNLPKIAPQFCYRLIKERPNIYNIESSININFQITIQKMLENYVEKTKGKNINNASVLVLNNQTGKVIVYCGSNNYNDIEHSGQVDGVKAFRSPGSALKPFLYTQSFEMGIYTPNSILFDIPINIGNYSPVNYDKTFQGEVSLKIALIQSLNIPAVSLLKDMGIGEFVKFLNQLGFNDIKKKESGYSLALGSCGVSLEQLCKAYSVFANQGVLKDFGVLKKYQTQEGRRVMSKEASYLTSNILQNLIRPDIPQSLMGSTFRIPKVAWKTGTSFGRKDAWAIGYNKTYTVGVWLGNFDGEGVPSLSGSETATPLLFNIFNLIDYNSNKQWFKTPKGISYRMVCSKTGHLPSDYCKELITDEYIENITLQPKCQHIIEVKVNRDSSFHYCNSCVENNDFITKQYLNIPAQLINYYEAFKISYPKIPPHYELCTRVYETGQIKIISPNHESEYLIETGSGTQLMLNAETDFQSSKVLWYINNKLVGETLPNTPLFIKPPFGILKIVCMDDLGRKNQIQIKVKEF